MGIGGEMIFINFVFFISNILVIIFGYLIIKSNIEKKYVNKAIIDNIKKEINALIVQLNETTNDNITLIEERVKRLDRFLKIVDKRIGGLDNKIPDSWKDYDKPRQNVDNFLYSPQKVVKQTEKMAEIISSKEEKALAEETATNDALKNLTTSERVAYLFDNGWSTDAIKKKLGLSTGEMELLLNIQNLNNN